MQQLNGLDALFAHNERQHAPMHIAALMVYTPQTTKHKKFRLQEVRNSIEQRLSVSPVFRRRLLTVPYNLDQPYWLEDETFNIDKHIHSHELTAKSSEADFHTLIATLHAQPMDMSRPLWEAHVIHGLGRLSNYSKGSFGIYMKVHHAALDGVSGTDILAALHGIEPLAFKPGALPDTWAGETPPSQWAATLIRITCKSRCNCSAKLANSYPSSVKKYKNTAATTHRGSVGRNRHLIPASTPSVRCLWCALTFHACAPSAAPTHAPR